MSANEVTAEAMALPLAEKVSLAQALWQSIGDALHDSDEHAAAREAVRRDEQLSNGTVKGVEHAEAMKAARGDGVRVIQSWEATAGLMPVPRNCSG
jgi:hypothetical protein